MHNISGLREYIATTSELITLFPYKHVFIVHNYVYCILVLSLNQKGNIEDLNVTTKPDETQKVGCE